MAALFVISLDGVGIPFDGDGDAVNKTDGALDTVGISFEDSVVTSDRDAGTVFLDSVTSDGDAVTSDGDAVTLPWVDVVTGGDDVQYICGINMNLTDKCEALE